MLKVKATEQKIRIGKYADTFRYVMQPEMYAQLAQDKVIKEAALRSGVSRGITFQGPVPCYPCLSPPSSNWQFEFMPNNYK